MSPKQRGPICLDKLKHVSSQIRIKGLNVRDRFVSPPILNLVIEGLPINGDPYTLIIEMGKVLEMDLNIGLISDCRYEEKYFSNDIALICFSLIHFSLLVGLKG